MLFQGLVDEMCNAVPRFGCVMLFQGLVDEMCNTVPTFG